MSERPVELQAILTDVRRRWTQRALLRAWTLGASVAATVVLVGLVAALLVANDGIPLLFTAAVVLLTALCAVGWALWPCRRGPTDRQLARLIEERRPDLDDVVVTAADYAARPDASPRMIQALASDAARVLSALNLDVVVSRQSLRQAAFAGAAATAALAVTVALFTPAFSRATNVAAAYLFPARLNVEVTPGTTKVRAGEALTITARISGLVGELVPTLTVAIGDDARTVRMLPASAPGTFAVTIDKVVASFAYHVSAAGARSSDYAVTVIRPARVERIDLHYDFPRGLGLESRTDEDSGDIYGPAGTKVRLTLITDKPIAKGFLLLGDGTKITLGGQSQALDGALTIEEDGS